MAKNAMGIKLPKTGTEDANCGSKSELARLRRNLSIAQVAERTTCSPLTVSRVKGDAYRGHRHLSACNHQLFCDPAFQDSSSNCADPKPP